MTPRGRAIVTLVATLVGVALTARLGLWQLDRAAQKIALQTSLDERGRLPALDDAALARDASAADAQHYRPVHVEGRWLPQFTVYLDNRPMDGRPGFYVVTPLLLAPPADAVLVQRGWVPRNTQDRTVLPPVTTPGGMVPVDGVIAPPPSRLYEFDAAASGPIRQNLDPAAFARETGLQLRPLSVQQRDGPGAAPGASFDASGLPSGDGLLRHWSAPAVDVQKHYGYAFQWFALAALMSGLYVWFQLVRPRLRRRP